MPRRRIELWATVIPGTKMEMSDIRYLVENCLEGRVEDNGTQMHDVRVVAVYDQQDHVIMDG